MCVTVRLEDRLPTVALAQDRLVEEGEPDLAVDGIFGWRTYASVRKFQEYLNLASPVAAARQGLLNF
jgi:peptidoglycan hydrolase-like protein with peptidoglycan-binding domain